MSWFQIVLMAVVSAVVTVPVVLFIPRARQSTAFDLLLWAATWVIGVLGAWAALGYAATDPGLSEAESFTINGVPVLPIVGGAVGAILLLSLVLWGMDRLAHPASEMQELQEMENAAGEVSTQGDVTSGRGAGGPGETEPPVTPENGNPHPDVAEGKQDLPR